MNPAPHDPLAPLPPDDPPTAARLHERLVAEAGDHDLLDVGYRTLDSPVGQLLLAATDRGLVRVAFDLEDHAEVLQRLAAEVSPRILKAPGRLDEAARQLGEYFDGRRRQFELPLDLRLAGGFRRQVIEHLRGIAYGCTQSYGQVARGAGSPRAVRAVGTACARNPVPVVVPCHRVVRSDGALGGYLGGVDAKRTLLELEAV